MGTYTYTPNAQVGAVAAFTGVTGRVSWKELGATEKWGRYDIDTLRETHKRHRNRHKHDVEPAVRAPALPPRSIAALLGSRKRQFSPSIPLHLLPDLVFTRTKHAQNIHKAYRKAYTPHA
jgi:hypothetical protein